MIFKLKVFIITSQNMDIFFLFYELQLVYGYNVDDIMKILPFIKVENPTKVQSFDIKRALLYGSHQVFLRSYQVVEEQNGFSKITDDELYSKPNSRYLGSPQRIYARYKYNYKNKLYFGITAEKDPGEIFFKNNIPDTLKNLPFYQKAKNGFDYYTVHFQINNVGLFRTIALGDYSVMFGQGLVIWSGMSYGKTPYVMNIKKKSEGIRKYSSTDENLFMRGAATTMRYRNVDLSVFCFS
jgi:hypothetical protein